MPELKEIIHLSVENDLHSCPACGYNLGFHTSFAGGRPGNDDPIVSTREIWHVILICPECGARYDVGWRASIIGSVSRSAKAAVQAPVCVPHGNPADCLPPRQRHDEHPP